MIVFNSIQRIKNSKYFAVQTSRSLIIVSIVSFLISYILFILNLQNTQASHNLIQVITIFFIAISFFFLAYHKKIYLTDTKLIIIKSFLLIRFKKEIYSLNDIQKIYLENRSFGQTIQDKYRIFVKIKNYDISIGVLNNKKNADLLLRDLEDYVQINKNKK
jgi:hypothetical protein